eukprot:SAG31_NODE_4806_length_2945_cov_14.704849_3_plen_169_part_00
MMWCVFPVSPLCELCCVRYARAVKSSASVSPSSAICHHILTQHRLQPSSTIKCSLQSTIQLVEQLRHRIERPAHSAASASPSTAASGHSRMAMLAAPTAPSRCSVFGGGAAAGTHAAAHGALMLMPLRAPAHCHCMPSGHMHWFRQTRSDSSGSGTYIPGAAAQRDAS